MAFKYTTISTECGDYKLSALLDKNGKYSFPYFEILDSDDLTKTIEIWDNVSYFLKTLIPYLKNEIEDEELDKYFSETKEEILELFEEGIEMGFFNELNKIK